MSGSNFHIEAVDSSIADGMSEHLDSLAKPPGSLGRLEELACRIAAIQRTMKPSVQRPRTVVFATSHDVNRAHSVSAYPDSVTAKMVGTFLRGGAAINAVADRAGSKLEVVVFGVRGLSEQHTGSSRYAGITRATIDSPNADITTHPAVAHDAAPSAISEGAEAADRAIEAGADVLALGEMGIGNTTPATAVACRLLDAPTDALVGPGTGLDADGVDHKRRIIEVALERSAATDPLRVLADLGGADLLAIAGAAMRAAERHTPVVVDGFIVSAALLAATRSHPELGDYLIPATLSDEPGHRAVIDALGAGDPLLDWKMRLGEASAATLVLPLLQMACAIPGDMMTLDNVLADGDQDATD